MPFQSSDPYGRLGLVICDECDAVLMRDGRLAAKKRGDSDPDELAPHEQFIDEAGTVARTSGWSRDGARWSCPTCAK
jgi:hypothetical protein